MTAIMVPKPAYMVRRGDWVVLLPRVIESRGSKGRHSGHSEDSGRYEVCSARLADGRLKLCVLDENLTNRFIQFAFDATVQTLEFM